MFLNFLLNIPVGVTLTVSINVLSHNQHTICQQTY